MNDNSVRVNSPKAWMLAVRPKTLSAAAVPVMIGTALAMVDANMQIRIVPAVLCFLFALVMQVDANFVNDYFDFVRGNDDETRLGPRRACAQGWITARAMLWGIAIVTVVACCVGLPLVLYGGWHMVVVGAVCVLFCFLYTTCLSYLGLGDLLVLVFFGVIPVVLTYYLEMPSVMFRLSADVLVSAVACGLVIDTLLVVNNYRDIDNDHRAGKMTLVARIGKRASELMYLGLGVVACAMGVAVFYDSHVLAALFPLAYLFPHVAAYVRMVRTGKGKKLNRVLGMTARNIFIYGILVVLGLLVEVVC